MLYSKFHADNVFPGFNTASPFCMIDPFPRPLKQFFRLIYWLKIMPTAMGVDKINVWSDARVQRRNAIIHGRTYGKPSQSHETWFVQLMLLGYLHGEPQDSIRGTVFLVSNDEYKAVPCWYSFPKIHGFPDLAVGWRYQIPNLLKLGMRVIVPDMMGYGSTVRTSSKWLWGHY